MPRTYENRAQTKKYKAIDDGKEYDVDDVVYDGAIINVNGTSIMDNGLFLSKPRKNYRYSVDVDGDEVLFETFADAYKRAKGGR